MEESRLVSENQNRPVGGVVQKNSPDESKRGRGDVQRDKENTCRLQVHILIEI